MALTGGLTPIDGMFDSVADLQASKSRVKRIVSSNDGTTIQFYTVSASDLGSGEPLASGLFANPIGVASVADPQTATNTANISTNTGNISTNTTAITNLGIVIPQTVSGTLTPGGRINQITDSGAFDMPLANSVADKVILIVELPDTFAAQTPTITRLSADLFRNKDGTDTVIGFVGAAKLTLTSDGVSEWKL